MKSKLSEPTPRISSSLRLFRKNVSNDFFLEVAMHSYGMEDKYDRYIAEFILKLLDEQPENNRHDDATNALIGAFSRENIDFFSKSESKRLRPNIHLASSILRTYKMEASALFEIVALSLSHSDNFGPIENWQEMLSVYQNDKPENWR